MFVAGQVAQKRNNKIQFTTVSYNVNEKCLTPSYVN